MNSTTHVIQSAADSLEYEAQERGLFNKDAHSYKHFQNLSHNL